MNKLLSLSLLSTLIISFSAAAKMKDFYCHYPNERFPVVIVNFIKIDNKTFPDVRIAIQGDGQEQLWSSFNEGNHWLTRQKPMDPSVFSKTFISKSVDDEAHRLSIYRGSESQGEFRARISMYRYDAFNPNVVTGYEDSELICKEGNVADCQLDLVFPQNNEPRPWWKKIWF